MINRKIVYLLAILVIVAGLSLWNRGNVQNATTPETTAVKIETPTVSADEQPTISATPPSNGNKPAQPTQADPIEAVKAPETHDYREEAAKDPHSTPPSLLAFADQMADAMDEAKKDEQKGSALFSKLDTCVMGDGPSPARALCAENAKRLAKMYPSLKTSLDDLMKKMPEDVARLVEKPKN